MLRVGVEVRARAAAALLAVRDVAQRAARAAIVLVGGKVCAGAAAAAALARRSRRARGLAVAAEVWVPVRVTAERVANLVFGPTRARESARLGERAVGATEEAGHRELLRAHDKALARELARPNGGLGASGRRAMVQPAKAGIGQTEEERGKEREREEPHFGRNKRVERAFGGEGGQSGKGNRGGGICESFCSRQ